MARRIRSRRAARKHPAYYLLPLGISIAIVVVVTLLFNLYSHMQQEQEQALKSQPLAHVSIDSDNVSVIFNNERTKVYKGYTIDWNNGEGLETAADARLSVPLDTKDQMRLDSNSTVWGKRDTGKSILLGFQKGNMWLHADAAKPALESTKVRMNNVRFMLTTQATVALADNEQEEIIAVVDGSLPVEVLDSQGNVTKSLTVGVGQQLRVNASTAVQPNASLLEAIPPATQESPWFVWNHQQDTAIASYEGGTDNTSVTTGNPNTVTFSNINSSSTFRSKTIQLEGGFDPAEVAELTINGVKATLNAGAKTWTASVTVPAAGKNTLSVNYTRSDGSQIDFAKRDIFVDESGPDMPQLTSPTATEVTSSHVLLQGTVGKETSRVVINGYELQKYTAGSTTWSYNLNAEDNMKEGTNSYSVVAYDSVGNESQPLVVTLTYTPSRTSTAANTNAASSTTTTTSNANSAVKPANQNTNKAPAKTNTNTATPSNTVTPDTTTPPASTNDNVLKPATIHSGSGAGL